MFVPFWIAALFIFSVTKACISLGDCHFCPWNELHIWFLLICKISYPQFVSHLMLFRSFFISWLLLNHRNCRTIIPLPSVLRDILRPGIIFCAILSERKTLSGTQMNVCAVGNFWVVIYLYLISLYRGASDLIAP